MISARSTILHRHVVPRVVNAAFQQRQVLLFNQNTTTFVNSSVHTTSKQQQYPNLIDIPSVRYMSTTATPSTEIRGMVSDGISTSHETKQKTPGHVTRSLRVLDMDVVRKILEELKAVDVNADGR
jgi:hypothetical protein